MVTTKQQELVFNLFKHYIDSYELILDVNQGIVKAKPGLDTEWVHLMSEWSNMDRFHFVDQFLTFGVQMPRGSGKTYTKDALIEYLKSLGYMVSLPARRDSTILVKDQKKFLIFDNTQAFNTRVREATVERHLRGRRFPPMVFIFK